MTSLKSATTFALTLCVLVFAIFWQATQHDRQCKNNIELCSTFQQCTYYHFMNLFHDHELQYNNLGICAKLLEKELRHRL